jgi:MoxR-like ATPase
MEETIFQQRTDLTKLNEAVNAIRDTVGKVIVGQHKMVDLMIAALLSDGHILIEGVPGVAKTLSAKLLAKIIDVNFSRLQFTPDLMPSDVIGTSVFNPGEANFQFKAGPVFSNIVLIDEINRAPAKTQAALFEVMEERQVTIDAMHMPPPGGTRAAMRGNEMSENGECGACGGRIVISKEHRDDYGKLLERAASRL